MYDSLITLIQMLDNSEKPIVINICFPVISISIGVNHYSYDYNQNGISTAIEEVEPLL